VTETIFRIMRTAVAGVVAAYCGLVLALIAFTDFKLSKLDVLLCVLMFGYALAMLVIESLDQRRGMVVPKPQMQPAGPAVGEPR